MLTYLLSAMAPKRMETTPAQVNSSKQRCTGQEWSPLLRGGASVREAEEIEEVGVHLNVLDVIEALAEEEHIELPVMAPHREELVERLPLCSALEIQELGVIRIISVLISRRVLNHVKPVRTDMSKQLFEEETLPHAALAEEKDILSPLSESRDKLGEPFLFVKLQSRQHQASYDCCHRASAAVGTMRWKEQSKIHLPGILMPCIFWPH